MRKRGAARAALLLALAPTAVHAPAVLKARVESPIAFAH
jgi:hypothetical protein